MKESCCSALLLHNKYQRAPLGPSASSAPCVSAAPTSLLLHAACRMDPAVCRNARSAADNDMCVVCVCVEKKLEHTHSHTLGGECRASLFPHTYRERMKGARQRRRTISTLAGFAQSHKLSALCAREVPGKCWNARITRCSDDGRCI